MQFGIIQSLKQFLCSFLNKLPSLGHSTEAFSSIYSGHFHKRVSDFLFSCQHDCCVVCHHHPSSGSFKRVPFLTWSSTVLTIIKCLKTHITNIFSHFSIFFGSRVVKFMIPITALIPALRTAGWFPLLV